MEPVSDTAREHRLLVGEAHEPVDGRGRGAEALIAGLVPALVRANPSQLAVAQTRRRISGELSPVQAVNTNGSRRPGAARDPMARPAR